MTGFGIFADVFFTIATFVALITIIMHATNNVWAKCHYKDDFGKVSKKIYLRQKKLASAFARDNTGSSKFLQYYTFIDICEVCFRFFEEDSNKRIANTTSSPMHFNIKCRASSGKEMKTFMVLESGESDFEFGTLQDNNDFIDILKNNRSVKIIIEPMDNNSNIIKNCSFTMCRGNFVKRYEKVCKTNEPLNNL